MDTDHWTVKHRSSFNATIIIDLCISLKKIFEKNFRISFELVKKICSTSANLKMFASEEKTNHFGLEIKKHEN